MKNKITDLRDHMFAQLERLGNEDLTPEQLMQEVERAKAISELGKVIVDSAKTQVFAAKALGGELAKGISEDAEGFSEVRVRRIA